VREGGCAPQAVFLVGFMGAGKTSVGRALGNQLGWPFEDLDDRIQAQEERTIEEIFQQSGEAAFRRAERRALRTLLSELGNSPRVIALGGGAFVQEENAALLNQPGFAAVFLDAPVEELFRRCMQEASVRPLRRNREQFSELYAERRPQYMTAGVRIVTTGKDVEAVAAEVAECLGLRPRSARAKEL